MMIRMRRLTAIAVTALRYRLDTLVDRDELPRWLRGVLYVVPRPRAMRQQARGVRLRGALESLGPLFVKFGQLVSTRRDLIPNDMADELAKLQDRVPPFASEQAIAIIEQALGQSVDQLFMHFDAKPLASASVAQVHAATLRSGEQVVVKVVRPHIEAVIHQDIAWLFMLARWIEKSWPDGKRLRPVEVVTDYQHTILDELDMRREAANTSQLKRHFQHSDVLSVPAVYFEYTRRDVLVLERVDGIAVTDIQALTAHGVDRRALAERGVNIFFTQVFEHNFFHADMHPGNVFVAKEHPENPQYIAIDCAIIGSLSDDDQYYLARNLLAIFQRDYRQVADLHIECGWVPPTTRVYEFEAAVRTVCEPVFEKPLGQIAFGGMLMDLFRTARRFDMQVQPSLVLLQKTLFNIEGLGRELYPQLNLWKTAKPFLEQWLRKRYSPNRLLRRLVKQLPYCAEQLPKWPHAWLSYLQHVPQRMDNGLAFYEQQQRRMEYLEKRLQRSRWWGWGVVAAALLWLALMVVQK